MSFKLCFFALLACVVAVQGAKLPSIDNTYIITTQREGRILEVPTLGDLIYQGLKVTWFVISSVWSLAGYKLATVALLSNVIVWLAQNCFSAVVGAAVTLAVCKLTGKCSLDLGQEYEVDSEELSYAAKHLEDGTDKFSF